MPASQERGRGPAAGAAGAAGAQKSSGTSSWWIEADGAAERKLTGREPLGRKAILRQNPRTRPNQTKKSCCPLFHAASKAAREELKKAYGLFFGGREV